MSGQGFDPERFRQLMAAEELLERLREEGPGAEAGQAPPREAAPETGEDLPSPVPEEEPPAGEDGGGPETAEAPEAEEARTRTETPEEAAAAAEPAGAAMELPFAEEPAGREKVPPRPAEAQAVRREERRVLWLESAPGSGGGADVYRLWDRRQERESRRYDGGFSLF